MATCSTAPGSSPTAPERGERDGGAGAGRGGGDLATGVAWTLHRAGLFVAVLELPAPLAIRRTVSFATAVANGRAEVEGVEARRVDVLPESRDAWIPLRVDASGQSRTQWKPDVVVDVRMAKRNLGTSRDDAPLVIAMGPGFVAGEDAHVVIETHRGHNLGRILTQGRASTDTGAPVRWEAKAHAGCSALRATAPSFRSAVWAIW